MHRECGFIRLKPDTNKVAFISAQNTGTGPIPYQFALLLYIWVLWGREEGPAVSYIYASEHYWACVRFSYNLF